MVADGVVPELLVKVPPAPPSDQTAAIAPPPNEPPNPAVVPPWQMGAFTGPTLTVGFGLTVNKILEDVLPHEPPLVVRVSVTGLEDVDEAV